ncbi:MAG: DUF4157 domain-containing protein [Leeuwenhoekiella sp.]
MEKEADAVADAVVLRKATVPKIQSEASQIQQKGNGPEEEEELQMKVNKTVRPGQVGSVKSQLASTPKTGTPLPASFQSKMENSLGYDFSGVSIHTDSKAQDFNKSLSSQAFTYGNSIYFDQGKYDPVSKSGQHLLAHELTHVVQQRKNARSKTLQRKNNEDEEKNNSNQELERILIPNYPGWLSVDDTDWGLKGLVKEVPNYIGVEIAENKNTIEIKEGKYKGKKAAYKKSIPDQKVKNPEDRKHNTQYSIKKERANDGANLNLEYTKNKHNLLDDELIVLGIIKGLGKDIKFLTQRFNMVPIGKHDIEIPDYQHTKTAEKGYHATTWFRIGHSGDRYMHPGMMSLGCITVLNMGDWEKIYNLLIKSRKSSKSVGTINLTDKRKYIERKKPEQKSKKLNKHSTGVTELSEILPWHYTNTVWEESDEASKKFMQKLSDLYGKYFEKYAWKYNIPLELVFIIIANEMYDYSWSEYIYEKNNLPFVGNTLGPAQIHEDTAKNYKLIAKNKNIRNSLKNDEKNIEAACKLLDKYINDLSIILSSKSASKSFLELTNNIQASDVTSLNYNSKVNNKVARAFTLIWNGGIKMVGRNNLKEDESNSYIHSKNSDAIRQYISEADIIKSKKQ